MTAGDEGTGSLELLCFSVEGKCTTVARLVGAHGEEVVRDVKVMKGKGKQSSAVTVAEDGTVRLWAENVVAAMEGDGDGDILMEEERSERSKKKRKRKKSSPGEGRIKPY